MSVQRRPLTWFVACFALCAVVSAAHAAERKHWIFDNGYYKEVGDKKWIEKVGDKTFRLEEKKHTEEYIELYDHDRIQFIRIYKHHVEARKAGESKYTELYKGKWEK